MTLEFIQTCWKAVREFGARERDPLGFIVGHKLVLLALGILAPMVFGFLDVAASAQGAFLPDRNPHF
jgi:hypothetical protein